MLRLRLHHPRPRLAPPARGLVRPSGPPRARPRPRPRPRPAFDADFCFALGGGEGRGRCSPLLCQAPAPCGAAPPAAALASGVPSRAAFCHSFPHVEARWPERPPALHLVVVGVHAGRCRNPKPGGPMRATMPRTLPRWEQTASPSCTPPSAPPGLATSPPGREGHLSCGGTDHAVGQTEAGGRGRAAEGRDGGDQGSGAPLDSQQGQAQPPGGGERGRGAGPPGRGGGGSFPSLRARRADWGVRGAARSWPCYRTRT